MQKLSPEVIIVKVEGFWALFRETGEPVYWLMSREDRTKDRQKETKERQKPCRSD